MKPLVSAEQMETNAAALLRLVLARDLPPIYLTDGRRRAAPNAIGRWYRRARGYFLRS